jgi:hypothetical protein
LDDCPEGGVIVSVVRSMLEDKVDRVESDTGDDMDCRRLEMAQSMSDMDI